jgi:predicted protein tyrosine phosphatase
MSMTKEPPVAAEPRTLIRVGGLHTLVTDLSGFRPTHMIGILDPDIPEYPTTLVDAADRERLLLRFHDTAHTEPGGPSAELVESLLAFIDRTLACERPVRLFVHCHAGISRSTATAYLALVRQHGIDGAETAFRSLLTIVNKPWPNRSIIALADDLLAARGRLLAPLDAYRQEYPRRIDAYARLHRRRLRRDPGYATRVDKPNWW